MPQAAEKDVLSLHWVEDIWVAHARRVAQVNNIILSAARNHHPALWISLFAYASILTPACFKIRSMPLTIGSFLFVFLSNSSSIEHRVTVTRYVRGITWIFYHCLFRTPIILNCQGDSDYPLISVFRLTHFSSYGQAIELKFYLWEKKVLWLTFPRKK